MADEHEAGRALDRLIGERVMGYTARPEDEPVSSGAYRYRLLDQTGKQIYRAAKEKQGTIVSAWSEDEVWRKCCPPFSTSIKHAWRVVRRMRRHQEGRNLQLMAYAYNRTYATFVKHAGDHDDWCEANGKHATPVAICLAALEACPEGGTYWLADDLFTPDDEDPA